MAQLVAHLHGMERVRGSNPLSSTDWNRSISTGFFVYARSPAGNQKKTLRFLAFEGLIPHSRNIYLRFKGLPKRDIRSMRGHPALESCGFRPGSTQAPTPRNADRCFDVSESTPRNEDSLWICRLLAFFQRDFFSDAH
mgnify:CR=1 FL=1